MSELIELPDPWTIHDRILFETIVADSSARFIHLEPEGVDKEIEYAQRVCLRTS